MLKQSFGRVQRAVVLGAFGVLAGCAAVDEAQAPDVPAGRVEASGLAAPVCVVIERGVAGSVADALISDVSPTKNYGASAALTCGAVPPGQRHGLLRFDLSAIPAGVTVTSATATLTVTLQNAAAAQAHRITAPWNEATVTWSSFNDAFLPQIEATFPAAANGGTTSASLTALAQAWVSGSAPNEGILLERDLTNSNVYASSEAAQAQRPRLNLCYQPGPCTGQANGTSCSDGNGCTQADTCQSGVCVGGAPVVCAAAGVCAAATTCNPTTGACDSSAAGQVWNGSYTITDAASVAAIAPYGVITGGLYVSTQATVSSVALPNLHQVGGDVMLHQTSLGALDLHNLASIGGFLYFHQNQQLATVDLSSLTSVCTYAYFYHDTALTSLSLGALSAVGSYLYVDGNSALPRLDLGALTSVGGYFYMTGNGLATFHAPALTTVGQYVYIASNTSLPTSCVSGLASQITSIGGGVTVSGNGSGVCPP